MKLAVVVSTEETEVVDLGLAAFKPGDDVMHVAPSGLATTVTLDAMAVTGHHGSAQGRRDDPGLAADVEDL